MTRSLSYHLRCRSEGEGKRQAGGRREREREEEREGGLVAQALQAAAVTVLTLTVL